MTEPNDHSPSLTELRDLLLGPPSQIHPASLGRTTWCAGELPGALLHLRDLKTLEGCQTLLTLACVRERATESTPSGLAVALSEILQELLAPQASEPDGRCRGALRALTGLEGDSRLGERQRRAGRYLRLQDGNPERSVRRVMQRECWSWALDRLIEYEASARARLSPKPSPSPVTLPETKLWTSPPQPRPSESLHALTVADSGLVVIKAILLAWNLAALTRKAGYAVEYVHEPWSESVLDAIVSGHLGMAIFNQERVLEYLATHESNNLRILGVFGHSMGGRNFCILAHREGRWSGVTAEAFLKEPRDARICVGLETDRFTNLLAAFNLKEHQLKQQGVTLINLAEPSLDVFLNDRDILLVGGQNIRFEALIAGQYLELVRYESLPVDRREWLRRSAANALVARAEILDDLVEAGVHDLYSLLKRDFYANWQDPRLFSSLLHHVINECDFTRTDPLDREQIARHILYETYRIGEPVW